MVNINTCSHRPVLQPCSLENYNFQIDPYIGCEHYCYYCYALNHAESDWSKEIKVHENLIDQLNKELNDIAPQAIYIGWNSDAYQPCEAKYEQTRKILELLSEKGFSACILTKSDLVIRDIDILKTMPEASVGLSLAFQNDHDRLLFEGNTVHCQKRTEALKTLHSSGITAYSLICPVIPLITDTRQLIKEIL